MEKKNTIRKVDVTWADDLERVVARAKSLSKRNNAKVGFTFNNINFIVNYRTPYKKIDEVLFSTNLKDRMDSCLNYDLSLEHNQTWEDRKLKDRLRLTFNQKDKSLLSIFNAAVERANNSDMELFVEHNQTIILFDKGDKAKDKIMEYYGKVKEENLDKKEISERNNYLPYIMQQDNLKNIKNINRIKSKKIKKITFNKK